MNVAIIAGAGHGTRMSRGRAKQFLELAGTPIIIHTLKRFERCADIHEIVVVVSASEIDSLSKLVEEHDLTKITNIVPGGASRAESVWRGLKVVSATTTEIVAVHD
ncbi:MAG: 2-C-methyl-D-erythritol 4-phosphate cytidylyltransferase, partial [Pyrinomonadaceae bacterium]